MSGLTMEQLFAEQVDEAKLAEEQKEQAAQQQVARLIPAGYYNIIGVDRAEPDVVPEFSKNGKAMRNVGRKYLDFFLTIDVEGRPRKIGVQASWEPVKIQGANGPFPDRETKNYTTLTMVYGKSHPGDVFTAFKEAPELVQVRVKVRGEYNDAEFVPRKG